MQKLVYKQILHVVMAGTSDNVELLLTGKVDELDGVAGDADGEVSVLGLLGVLHSVLELLDTKDVDVEVVSAVGEVTVHHVDEVGHALVKVVAESGRVDRLRVGDAVESPLVGELGDGVEGSEKAALLSAVGGVGTRSERGECLTAVGSAARSLAVHHVGGDGKDRGGRLGVAVSVMLGDLLHEGLEQPHCDLVRALVVVAVLGEVALDLVVDNNTLLVADGLDLGVLDSADRVDNMGEAGDARSEGAADVGVDECHLGSLIVVLVVHVLDEVEDVDVKVSEPVHHEVELVHDLVVVEVLARDGRVLRSNLHVVALLVEELLVLAAVDGVVERLGEVGTRMTSSFSHWMDEVLTEILAAYLRKLSGRRLL